MAQNNGLVGLEERLRGELEELNLPARPWVSRKSGEGAPDYDVIVIGGGMLGLAATAALQFQGVTSVLCLDRAERGREGPWLNYARMRTLRTPKTAVGPALGVPALTFRAWFSAQYGIDAWNELDKIPTPLWMAYLCWYRKVLALPVRNQTDVTDIAFCDNGLIAVSVTGNPAPLTTRRVVIATGIDGLGQPALPPVASKIPRRLYAHSSDPIDFEALQGKRVGVVGAGSSAMDNAATALEAGASAVDLFVRRECLPDIDKFSGISHEGLIVGYVTLPDEVKWKIMRSGYDFPVPAPRESVLRVFRHANARMHLGSPIVDARERSDGLVVRTPHDEVELDYLIFATGFACALDKRPELHRLAPLIRLWRDSFTPALGENCPGLAALPDLADDFSFRAKNHQHALNLSHVYAFSFDATLSHGKLTSGAPGLTEAAQRLARGVVSSLLREDAQIVLTQFSEYSRSELLGNEWSPEQVVTTSNKKEATP
ncbi:NAD(P)/FAD-dependent oxidoreductase [Acetobacter sp. TBRC 12305]|uniref:NAD(P)/FAD-dependent oxidoreductase n=1 Tax=Acetobacter garciniae TaxID=2817435 RepID=A0A939KRW4_9PROT|nr:NAD(P)/FAD-dependent oxidoreductase [Acetobacter garciniae]MBO1326306.1 NAD(P)/FAD-dependent oxidoreductase [Acetobacter garciniae]MBX0346388.1 NAD(P)/FAD-dependent oxidoreductase [Acetobacter garciniae]